MSSPVASEDFPVLRRATLVSMKRARPSISQDHWLRLEQALFTAHHKDLDRLSSTLTIVLSLLQGVPDVSPEVMIPLLGGHESHLEKLLPDTETSATTVAAREYEKSIEEFTEFVGSRSLMQCGSCKEKNVSWTARQTRSADEGSTIFCECLSCGKKWKYR